MSQQRPSMLMRGLLCSMVGLGLALFAAGEESRADTPACNHADVVFYNATDTGGRLAGELKKFTASCTDYWVSVTPRTGPGIDGWPRGGTPLTAIHPNPPVDTNYHAMAEIRLNPWAAYVNAGHTWYEAGLRVRELMRDAGYDSNVDTWAVNEVGAPSLQTMGVDVLKNSGDARQNLRNFVRGLYTGDGTPMPGLVFVANPVQASTNLTEYRSDLENWYADSAFWEDMSRYVRFWAQEAYADSRAWGVPGTTLTERTAYLNDYFMHGARVAAREGDSARAALEFLADAYTPVGNATYRATTGFGYTDIDLVAMKNFVSTQTYALRSSSGTRFGFADQRIGAATVPNVIEIEDRVAAAIRDSGSEPIGACGASGEWCDSSVAGAQFTGLWRELGTPTPPTIVPRVQGTAGNPGWYIGDVTVTWDVGDSESPVSSTSGCGETLIDADTEGTTLTCTATSFGGTDSVSVTIKRDATAPTVSCEPTPATLWPPNHQLVSVAVELTIDDETSGPGAFALSQTSSSESGAADDISGFQLDQPDVEGLLRAERSPASDGRSYVLTYVAHDAAGNTAGCVATVVVPHDLGD